MKIGNIELKGQVILAPMAGICNSAYRKICKEMGAASRQRVEENFTLEQFGRKMEAVYNKVLRP